MMLAVAASTDYFEHSRQEIAPLLPAAPGRVLEVGCSSGATLAWLRARWPAAETVGVDGYEPIRDVLAQNADTAIIQNLEAPLPELGRFDLVLALDILEHLTDPATVLQGLVSRLNPGGSVIVSVPNVGHVSILADLLLRRRFQYQDAGILDRTHLRFFTEESAVGLMNAAGLVVQQGVVNGPSGRKSKLFNTLTLGLFRHYFAKQYIMLGTVSGNAQGSVNWRF
jgi:2-polyprenyl-3-methyl-5-hydroxy-6-metoxy-1,4-benzoquinol methylase